MIMKLSGEYQLTILCNNQHIRGSPFKINVPGEPSPQEQPHQFLIINPEPSVPVAIGGGLVTAKLNEVSEFIVDGCCDSQPKILLTGVSGNVPVTVANLGNGRFKCSYRPEKTGIC